MDKPTSAAALPERTRQILAFVHEKLASDGRAPSIREIGRELGITSTSAVAYHLSKLAKAGLLKRTDEVARGLSIPGAFLVIAGDRVAVRLEDGSVVAGELLRVAA